MIRPNVKRYSVRSARAFMEDHCTHDEIVMLDEGGIIKFEEGDSIYDVDFDCSDMEIIEDVLRNRKEEYILEYIDDNYDGYFLIMELPS